MTDAVQIELIHSVLYFGGTLVGAAGLIIGAKITVSGVKRSSEITNAKVDEVHVLTNSTSQMHLAEIGRLAAEVAKLTNAASEAKGEAKGIVLGVQQEKERAASEGR
jgi:hypothetical protein